MDEAYPRLLSDHLADALHNLDKARRRMQDETVIHREAAVRELTQAQLSISRVIGLIAGAPP